MNKSTFPSLLYAIICLVLSGCGVQDHDSQPNVVFILVDDLGWADLPCYGNAFHETPNIDRLRSMGVQFTEAYAASPVCSPTRASIQTGMYPARLGINDFITGHWRPHEQMIVPINRTQYLPLEMKTIGEVFKENGYASGYYGKWHLGWSEDHQPGAQGYDEWRIHRSGALRNLQSRRAIHPEDPNLTDDQLLSSVLTDYSLDFIDRNSHQPFFLFLSHFDVHVQLDADSAVVQEYISKSVPTDYPGNAVYAAMIEHVDQSVGRILDQLESIGELENTIFVFFSDNGGLVSRFDRIPLIAEPSAHFYQDDTLAYIATSNHPLSGEKGSLYEGGIRVPLLISWPNRIRSSGTSNQLASSIDLLPTLASLCGIELTDPAIDGIDLTEVLYDPDDLIDRSLFWHYPVYHHDKPAGAMRYGNLKLIHRFDGQPSELYNLENDLAEEHNLANSSPDQLNQLRSELTNWQERIGAEMPVVNPDFDQSKRHEWGRHPSRD